MRRTLRVEFPGAIYRAVDGGERCEDISVNDEPPGPGANRHFQGRPDDPAPFEARAG
jgi:hypothetical protein